MQSLPDHISGNANHSQRVLDEVNLAISQQAVIFPFRIENLEPKGAMKLHLSSRHWLDAYDPSWQSHIKKLIKDVSANLETTIEEQDIVVPKGVEKKAKQQKKLTRILTGVVVGAILVTAGWLGLSSLNKKDRELSAQTETDTSIPQDSPADQEPESATPINTWGDEISEPILDAIEDAPPDFADDFSQVDPGWNYHPKIFGTNENCSNTDGANMEISDGSLKISVDPNCTQADVNHPKMMGYLNYVMQTDINFNKQPSGKIYFETVYDQDINLGFWLSSYGEWGFEQYGHDNGFNSDYGKLDFDASKPTTVTIIKKGSMFFVYLNSTLLVSYNDIERFSGAGKMHFTLMNDSSILAGIETFELDNVKVWDLDKIEISDISQTTSWVEDTNALAEPILETIKDQPPDFWDIFSQKDPDWRNYSDDRFCDLNKAEMNITNGSMQCSISPGCPFFVFTHPDIEKQDSDYVLQMDVTFPEQTPDLALEFAASIMDCLLVDFILSDESWAITIPVSDIDETMQGIDSGPIRSNTSKPVTLTIMKKDTIFLFYRDSELLTSYGIQPEEADGHRIAFSIANWSESLIETQMIKLDDVKVWSLKSIDY